MPNYKHSPEQQIEAFWEKVDLSGDDDACWIWMAGCSKNGYGAYHANGKTYRAHRYSWELAHGAVPTGLYVLHNCPNGDNKRCVNPAHLWLGTHQDNMDDRGRKGRTAKGDGHWSRKYPEKFHLPELRNPLWVPGEEHVHAKLNNAIVRDIRRRYSAGGITQTALAIEYGVTPSLVCGIINRRFWSHLEEEGVIR